MLLLCHLFGNTSNDVSGLYHRGMTLSKMGKLSQAIRDLSTVLEIDPSHVNAAYARAACYNSKGQFSQAIEDYNLALTKDEVS